MSGRRLTFAEAAEVIAGADPLVDVRLSMGWSVNNGQRLPVLRISSKSTIDYRAKAKPLGTIYGAAGQPHYAMLFTLSLALRGSTVPASMVLTDRRIEVLRLIGSLWRGDWSGHVFDGRDGNRWIETAITGTAAELTELVGELQRIEAEY